MVGAGSGLQHIHLVDLRRDFIPVAPAHERSEIVRRGRAALAWIDRLASEATSARKLIDHLDQAVLAKAFRGELVPQDPKDEPASVLLDASARRARRAWREKTEGDAVEFWQALRSLAETGCSGARERLSYV
jgi:type I restriction enzyme, S subunit